MSSTATAAEEKKGVDDWGLKCSDAANNTFNPIRNIVDKLVPPKSHPKKFISLSIGDPAVYGNLIPAKTVTDAVKKIVDENLANGYTHSAGHPATRAAVADWLSAGVSPAYCAEDVLITSGGSQAVLIALQGLCNPGDNILIPSPGFSLYRTIAGNLGVDARHYKLLPEKSWECSIEHMESLIDKNTRLILINNPGNPTGSNYSRAHLEDIVALAAKHRLPIVSDEIYAHMVFAGQTFTPLAAVSGGVPVLTLGGVAKQFLVPGWRVGWIALCDRKQRMKALRPGLLALTQLILGANTLVQAALPVFLKNTPPDYYDALNKQLERQANAVVECLRGVPGLTLVVPQACMYVMIRIDTHKFKDIKDDQEFAQKLLVEQNISVLPGACFTAPDFVRIVFCAPEQVLADAAARIKQFTLDHLLPGAGAAAGAGTTAGADAGAGTAAATATATAAAAAVSNSNSTAAAN